MLKRFNSLLFAIFGGSSPFYRKLKSITYAFWEYLPNAQTKLTMESKSSILWIIFLQARRFALGKMTGETPCLG